MSSPMATPPNDDTRNLFKILADSEWHDYYQVRDQLALTVSPSRAVRKYETRRDANRNFRKSVAGKNLTLDEQIHFGQRACAQICITSWKGRGVIQRIVKGPDGQDIKEIKIKPGFKVWGVEHPVQQPSSAQDPPPEAGGSPEVPPDDSEPSVESGSGPEPEPEPDPLPEAATVPAPSTEPVVEGALSQKRLDDFAKRLQKRLNTRDEQKAAENARPVSVEAPAEPPVGQHRCPACDRLDDPGPLQAVTDICLDCGLFVADEKVHAEFHATHPKAPETAPLTLPEGLLTADQAEKIFKNILAAQLDGFQQGMQGWLIQQFTQLTMAIGAAQPIPSWMSPARVNRTDPEG